MQSVTDFARGPLFAVAILVFVLGMGRHVVLQVHGLLANKGRRLQRVSWLRMMRESLGWVVPLRHLVRGTVFVSLTSFLFHVGALLVPLFYAGHVVLWQRFLGIGLPAIGRVTGDVLTLSTCACCLFLLCFRAVVPRARHLSRFGDYLVLVAIFVPFATGFMAAHPRFDPLPWTGMYLVHILSAEVLLVAAPFTKLSHIVLFAFDRISLVHWQLRPGAGDRVAEALYGGEARV